MHPIQVRRPPHKPLLIYDGDCRFCRMWITRWRLQTGDGIDYATYQESADRFPEIPPPSFKESVKLISPDGRVYHAAEAVLRSLACQPSKRWLLWSYIHLPGMAAVSEFLYQLVAANRRSAAGVTRFLWGARLEPPTYRLASWLFLRLIGVVYLAAFLSLWLQIEGLVGSEGILPVGSFIQSLSLQMGWERFWQVPTLFWLDAGHLALHLVCGGGVLLAALLILGIAPRVALFLAWVGYLSLVSVCGVFLGYQWDNLLLEAGLLAVFLAPRRLRSSIHRDSPPRAVRWMLRWLLFRLMFLAGVVKLASHDPTWRDLSALKFHFETQPLPTWLGWYAHQLPDAVLSLAVLLVFLIELVAAFLIFGPRRMRLAGFWILVTFQLLIAATGNYAFFNWLTIVLCILLLDDLSFPHWMRKPFKLVKTPNDSPLKAWRRSLQYSTWPLLAFILFISGVLFLSTLGFRIQWPASVVKLVQWSAPFRSINSYGLFAVMTTSRPEIVIEGSRDGESWIPYQFRYKAGEVDRRPGFVAPHQPRLDWQMWFAALGSYRQNPWLARLMRRLLEGSPSVLGLLADNPFRENPPRYIRAVLYDYRFTRMDSQDNGKAWWVREFRGPYSPTFTLAGSAP